MKKDRFKQCLDRRDRREQALWRWGRNKPADVFFNKTGWDRGVGIANRVGGYRKDNDE